MAPCAECLAKRRGSQPTYNRQAMCHARTLVLVVFLSLLTTGGAFADRVYLANGNTLDGSATVYADGTVELTTALGVMTFAPSQVIRVVRGRTFEQQVRRGVAHAESSDDVLDLALRSRREGKETLARQLVQQVLDVEPHNREAQRILEDRTTTERRSARRRDDWCTPSRSQVGRSWRETVLLNRPASVMESVANVLSLSTLLRRPSSHEVVRSAEVLRRGSSTQHPHRAPQIDAHTWAPRNAFARRGYTPVVIGGDGPLARAGVRVQPQAPAPESSPAAPAAVVPRTNRSRFDNNN